MLISIIPTFKSVDSMEKRKEMNQKAWYRLLKVVFITFFLASYSLYAVIVLSDTSWKELDQKDTKVTCSENRQTKDYEKPITFKLSEVDAEIPEQFFNDGRFDYKSFLSTASEDYYYHSYDLFRILSECFPDRESDISNMSYVHLVQRFYELVYQQGFSYDEAKEMAASSYEESVDAVGYYGSNELLFNYHLFDVEPNYKYLPFVWPLTWGFLTSLLIFEIVRRIFYYIAFGSFLFTDYSKVYSRLGKHFRKKQ